MRSFKDYQDILDQFRKNASSMPEDPMKSIVQSDMDVPGSPEEAIDVLKDIAPRSRKIIPEKKVQGNVESGKIKSYSPEDLNNSSSKFQEEPNQNVVKKYDTNSDPADTSEMTPYEPVIESPRKSDNPISNSSESIDEQHLNIPDKEKLTNQAAELKNYNAKFNDLSRYDAALQPELTAVDKIKNLPITTLNKLSEAGGALGNLAQKILQTKTAQELGHTAAMAYPVIEGVQGAQAGNDLVNNAGLDLNTVYNALKTAGHGIAAGGGMTSLVPGGATLGIPASVVGTGVAMAGDAVGAQDEFNKRFKDPQNISAVKDLGNAMQNPRSNAPIIGKDIIPPKQEPQNSAFLNATPADNLDVLPNAQGYPNIDSKNYSDPTDDFLKKIAAIESNGGTNFNHPTISNPKSIHYNQQAIGTYALMPKTVNDLLKGSKNPEDVQIVNMPWEDKKQYLESHPDAERRIARIMADQIISKKGYGDEAAYAWEHGPNVTPEHNQLDDSDYVQKFRALEPKKEVQNTTEASRSPSSIESSTLSPEVDANNRIKTFLNAPNDSTDLKGKGPLDFGPTPDSVDYTNKIGDQNKLMELKKQFQEKNVLDPNNYQDESSLSPEKSKLQSLLDSFNNIQDNHRQGLISAQEASNSNDFNANLLKAANMIGAGASSLGSHGVTGPAKIDNTILDGLSKTAGKPVEQYEQNVGNEKNDSNSQYSKGLKAFLQPTLDKFNITLPDNINGATLEKIAPLATKMYDQQLKAEYNIEAKKLNSNLQGDKKQEQSFNQVRTLLESARGNPAAAQAERDIYSADKADDLAKLYGDPNKLSMAQVRLLASEIAKMATGGAPTMMELKGISPESVQGLGSVIISKFTNEPTPANAAKFVKSFQDYTRALRETAQGVIQDKYGRIIESSRKSLGEDHYNDLINQYINRFKNKKAKENSVSPEQLSAYAIAHKIDEKTAKNLLNKAGFQVE